MTRTFLSPRTIMTGLIGTRLFSGTNATLETAGSYRRKGGSLIRRSTREPRQTLIQERRIHFPQVLFFSYEEFNNGGADIRLRKLWGDDTIFRGSALTFGTVVYHGDAPFQRYTLTDETSGPNFLFAPRGTNLGHHPSRSIQDVQLSVDIYRGSCPHQEISHG